MANLEKARAVADAVLYEGYLLYPYRASSRKNQVRWQFGIVGPAGAAAEGIGEDPAMQTECLVEPRDQPSISVRLRFLQLQSRDVEQATGSGPEGTFLSVPELRSGAQTWLRWDEAVELEIDVVDVSTSALLAAEMSVPVEIPGGKDIETLRDADGSVIGRLVRRRQPLSGLLRLTCRPSSASRPLVAVRVGLTNAAGWTAGGSRDDALARSFIGTHLLLSVQDGQFVSLLDPPEWAAQAAAACAGHRCWPVLVGAEGEHDVVLASPIILYDWPAIAAESQGELFDSTEIDEILTLRVMTMTDEEKREARATDPRAGAILDRCDGMPPEVLARLHGSTRELTIPQEPSTPQEFSTPHEIGDADEIGGPLVTHLDGGAEADWSPMPIADPDVPWWDPAEDASVSPGTDAVDVAGVPISRGSKVRLRPSRRADAHDIFFVDQTATVAGVHFDVDGNVHVAVLVDGDPASDLHGWYGRYLYFGPEELEPLETAS